MAIRNGDLRRDSENPTWAWMPLSNSPAPAVALPDQPTAKGFISHHLARGEGQLVDQASGGQGISADGGHHESGDALWSPPSGSPHSPLVPDDSGQTLQCSHIGCQTQVDLLGEAITSVLGFCPILPPCNLDASEILHLLQGHTPPHLRHPSLNTPFHSHPHTFTHGGSFTLE